MTKFRVEYGYPTTMYDNFEVEADSLVAAEVLAVAELKELAIDDSYIDLIEEAKVQS